MRKLILFLSVLFVVSCSSSAEEEPAPVIKYTLTTSVNPVDSGFVNPNGGTVDAGQQISVTATPAAEYIFDKWTGAASGTDKTVLVIMDSHKSVTANFIKKKYTLTITVEGEGTVAEKVIKAGAATDYNSGTIVELTATPSSRWEFKEWTGDLTGTENPKQITIDKAKAVTAVFEEELPFYLDANGVTIKAKDWVTVGTTGELNGVTYTAVNIGILTNMIDEDKDVTKVVTTKITSMRRLFYQRGAYFNQDISSWDVSNVTNMSSMFLNNLEFNKDISSWDVSNVTNFESMFRYTKKFNQPLDNWNVGNAKYMDSMFQDAFVFNQDLSSWDVSNVEYMYRVFQDASVFNQDLSSWDVSNVEGMSYMFYGAYVFNQDLSSWDVSNVEYMSYMFQYAYSFNQDIGSWDVSNVTNMDSMFFAATVFNQDLTKWCVTNITTEPLKFSEACLLTEVNKPVWGTCPGNSYTIAVTSSSNADYTLSGKDRNGDVSGNDPGLTFKVGDEVTFSVNADGHPFYLKTVAGTGTDNQISGVTNNGTSKGSIVWTPTAAGTYYYQCSAHSGMVGTITIQN